MSNVLFIYENNIPTVSLTYNNFSSEYAKERGINASFKSVKEITKKDLNANDVFFFIRPTDIISKKLAKSIRKSNGFIVIFCDDDLMDYPDDFPGIPYRIRCTKKVLKNANVVLSSSQHFVDKYYQYSFNKRKALINTAVDANELQDPSTNNNTVKILYAGSTSHLKMFDDLIKPIFSKLCDKFGHKISFTFIGVNPDLREYENLTNITYKSSMPLDEYRSFVKNEHFDIGLAPLFDSEFAKSKYFNKYIEYSMIGTVGIYSKVEPYIFVIKDGTNGYLADNQDDWFNKLSELIENNSLRKTMIQNAQEDIKVNFNKKAIYDQLLDSIPELSNIEKKHSKICGFIFVYKFNYYFHRIFDIIYLLFFFLVHKGVKGLIYKIKLHNKEKKSIKKLENK